MAEPLLYASTENFIPWKENNQAGYDSQITSYEYITAGGDLESVTLQFGARIFRKDSALSEAAVNDINIIAVSVQTDTQTTPVTFSGNRSVTVSAGVASLLSDSIPASALGLTTIPNGTKLIVKVQVNVGADGYVPTTIWDRNATENGRVVWFNEGVHTVSSVDDLGTITYGENVAFSKLGYHCHLLGVHTAPATAIVARGDSLTYGTGDLSASDNGFGWFRRMCQSSNGEFAMLHMAVAGSYSPDWLDDPFAIELFQHANYGIIGLGTNDINYTPRSLETITANLETLSANMRSAGIQHIGRVQLSPCTNSTDNFLTETNQTLSSSEWGAGGKAELLNQSLSTLDTDFVITVDSVRGTDPYKWLTDGVTEEYTTTDGTHMSPYGAELRANEALPIVQSYIQSLSASQDFLYIDGIKNVVETDEHADIDWANDDYSIEIETFNDLLTGSVVAQSTSSSTGLREFQLWLKNNGEMLIAVIGGESTNITDFDGQVALPKDALNIFTKSGTTFTLTSDGVQTATGTLNIGSDTENNATLKLGGRSDNSNSKNASFCEMRLSKLRIRKNGTLYANFDAGLANKTGDILPDSTGNFTARLVDFNPDGGYWFTNVVDATVASIEVNGMKYQTLYIGDTYVEENATLTRTNGDTEQLSPTGGVSTNTAGLRVIYYNAGDLIVTREIAVQEKFDLSRAGYETIGGIRSWWTGPLSIELDNGNTLATYTDFYGLQGVVEYDEQNLIVGHRVLTEGFYGRDSHNAPAVLKTSGGRLITLFTGHGISRQFGGGDKTYWCAESATGNVADFTSTKDFIPSLSNDGSNYLQLFESDSGKIVALTNMDGAGGWYPVYRTAENEWEFKQPLTDSNEVNGGGNGQYYNKAVMLGNRIRLFGMIHASNAEGHIRVIEYDVDTLRVYTSNTDFVVADGTADDAAATSPINNASIRQAGTGRGQRLVDVSADGLKYIVADYDSDTGNNGVYIFVYCTDPSNIYDPANWSEKVITTYLDDSYLDKSRFYVGSAVFAPKPVLFAAIALSTLTDSGYWEVAYFELDDVNNDFVRSQLYIADKTSSKITGVACTENKVHFARGTHSTYTSFDTNMYSRSLPASLEVVNPVPTVNAGANINATNGDTVTLSGATASDYDSLAWTCTSGQSPTITNGNTLTPTITFNEAGVHTLRLTATNAEGSTFDALDVDVSAVQNTNQPPVANAGPDQSVAAATQFTLDGTGSQDTDGIIVEWRWTQTAGDTVTLDLENPSSPRAISPSKTTPQTLTFSLVIVDDEGAASSPSLVNIDVSAVVQNDVLNIIDKISFTFESDGMITAFPGRANRETFRLKPSDPTGLVLEDGWFDFEANDVRRVEISMLETTGVKIISSDTDSIIRERSKLHARMGDMPIKSSTKEFEPTVSVFVGNDERGVVMTAPGLSGAPKVKYYSTTARAV